MRKLVIGNVELDNNLILAPMAGVTDQPFRALCKENGCGLMYTEMVSAKALLYNNKNTDILLKVEEKERPIALQLFGSDPDIISEMAKKLEDGPYDIFDINMGCPVPKVVNNGEGSALMKNPKLVERIITKLAKAVNKPVTVKIRRGFNEDMVNADEIARIAEASGAAAVAVHGRTREQYYSGTADLEIIKKVKDAVKIPVIGNGDIVSPESAVRMLDYTGCDGLMIGRGAKGNPFIFRRLLQYFDTGVIGDAPTNSEIESMILRHAALSVEFKGEYIGIREMRKHVAWYTTGLPHSAELRQQVNQVESLSELTELVHKYFCFS